MRSSCRLAWILLALVLGLGRQAWAQAGPATPAAGTGHYLAVRGIRLYYEEYGGGPPLLLLHGNGGSHRDFARNIPYFARHYRVIALDSRAHGRSTDPADSLSFEQLADDAAAVLGALRLDSANVLGWSDGGIVALLLALRHPAAVRRLAATGANLSPDSTALVPALWRQQQRGYLESRGKVFADPVRRNEWKIFLLDVFQPHVPLERLRKLAAPAFIIAGDHDVITLGHTVAIYQHVRRGWLWIVPHSGHATLQEHTDEFNKQVDAFFKAATIVSP